MPDVIDVPVFKNLEEVKKWREQHPVMDRKAELIYFDRLQRLADAEFKGLKNIESYVPAEHTDDFWKYNNVFDSDVYRQEVNRILPHNQFDEAPTVDQIKKWVEEDILYSSPSIESPTSIPFAEKELGIKLSGDYKFPDGMTSIEYGKQRFFRYGGSGVAPFEDFGYKELTEGCSQREAYVEVWKRIHYNKDMVIENLKKDFMELCELNPELRKVKVETANKLWSAIDGALYNFPADDIKLFVSADELLNLNDEELFKVECMEAGIRPPEHLNWRLSEDTRKKIIAQLKEKSEYQLSDVYKKTGVFGVQYIDRSTGEILLKVSSADYRGAMAEMMSWPENLKNVAKSVEQSVAESGEQTAEKTVERAATKSTMKTENRLAVRKVGNALFAANKAYDEVFDRNVAKLMEMDAPQWMKNVDKAMGKVVDNKATRYTAQQLQKAAEVFVKTPTGEKIAAQVAASYAKIGGRAAVASAAKKIPLVCVGIACAMAKERFEKGDYVKGSLEVVSGIAACVPIFGTAVSLGIDAGVLASDLSEAGLFAHETMQADPNSHMAAESTFVDKPIIVNQEKLVKKVDKLAEAKKKAESKKKAQKFEKNLYKYGSKQADFFER